MMKRKKEEYVRPLLELLTIGVEQGFAGSGEEDMDDIDRVFGDYYDEF